MNMFRCDRLLTRLVAAVPVGILAAASAFAQLIPGYPQSVQAYDPREVALLPRFCLFTIAFRMADVPGGESQAETEAWYARVGPSFQHLHHYCWGLMSTNRGVLLARDAQARRFYLSDSINEFDYVIKRVPRDFVLLPEILTKKGANLIRLGTGALGVVELERAIELKPDYWPPYAELSDYYKATGDIDKARSTLTTGLERSPDASALKRRLGELSAAKKIR
jgi:hypothetical protein